MRRDACPPLPGAIYVAVRRIGHLRTVVAMGRFSPFWDGASSELAGVDADEIHVHLLARDNAAANAVLNDLQAAFVETRQSREPSRLEGLARRRWLPASCRECSSAGGAPACS